MKKPELLAPAGDLKRCITAIDYGADAVYIGGTSFSLRSRASNFTVEDIREACAYARKHGAHIHVTVNVIPHEEDFEGLKEYLLQLQDAGVTAIIAASGAVMKLAKEIVPDIQVHCSTQMSVTNADAAAMMCELFGLDRVVLARECTLEDVRQITDSCPKETEAFIHGGMCVNYSGRCTLSNRMTLRDANRGGCAQSCRWNYNIYEDDRKLSDEVMLTMGSKDLCAVYAIYDLMAAGVSSFKIEGRMKTEYYVASVVSAYRHLIDELYEAQAPLSEERMRYHRNMVMRCENRETWPGFYQGDDHDSLIYHPNSDVDVRHDFLGTVHSYDPVSGTCVIETRNPFSLHDQVEILSPVSRNDAFALEVIRNEQNEDIESSRHPMRMITVNMPYPVIDGDILRRAL